MDKSLSTSESHPTTPGAPQLRSILETVGLIVAPATLLTGLLVYFGRVYTTARLAYFGIDPNIAGFSTQEYVLRSIQPMFLPLAVLALLGLILLWIHSSLPRRMAGRQKRMLNALPPILGAGGTVLVAFGVAGLVGYPVFGSDLLVTPVSFAFGTIGISYGVYLWNRLHRAPTSQRRWPSLASVTLVCLLVTVQVFWAMGDWAVGLGRGRAQELASELTYRAPGVILYSKQPLSIDPATGVTMERIGGDGTRYSVRYQRLKLFLHSAGKYFLVPADWSPATGVVIILSDSDDFRIELTPP